MKLLLLLLLLVVDSCLVIDGSGKQNVLLFLFKIPYYGTGILVIAFDKKISILCRNRHTLPLVCIECFTGKTIKTLAHFELIHC
jgi:hypothetical protein